ncbi:MAG: hypothetical protein ACRDOI_07940 [Trebonia sp.]
MNISYLIYQAERPRSVTEQREADVRAGELAAAVTRLGRSLRRSVTERKQDAWRGGQPPAIETIACAVPRPR